MKKKTAYSIPGKKITTRQFLKKSVGAAGGMYLLCTQPSLFNSLEYLINEEPGKWSRESMFYEQTPRGTKCLVCPNECTLKPGETSDCHNRINYKGILYSIAYGNPCAVNLDPVEKKPLLHFLPQTLTYSIATAGCNLTCLNCQNWNISQASPKETKNYDLLPAQVVEKAKKNNCRSIAYTYSEPITFYEYVYDTSRLSHSSGIKNILVSNGYINQEPLEKLCPHLDAANIDLKSFSEKIYLKLTAGKLQPVLDTLKTLKKNKVWLEITNLVIPGWTDDMGMIREMCSWLYENGFKDTPLHFSRFHPMYKLTQLPPTPFSTLLKARKTAQECGLLYVYIGNVPIKGTEDTICPACSKKVIERIGFKVTASHLNEGKCAFCNTSIAGIWE